MLLSLFASDADRSPWGDFWFKPVPFRGAGADVTPEVAMQLTAVLACVRIISEGVAMLPFQLRQPKDGGGWTYVTDHWLYRLFARRPNAYQNPFEFREMMQGHLALRGNAYAEIFDNAVGEVTDLLPIHPDAVQIETLDNGSWRYKIKQPGLKADRILTREQVFHIRGLSNDGVMGINPIAAARDSLAVGLAAQSYGARFFQNDGKPGGGWIEYPGKFANSEAKAAFAESWQRTQAGQNRGKTAVLEFGMKYHEVGVTNDDAQFLETRKFQVTEIARLFRVPPHLIADLERATFSNIEQQSIDYVMHTLTPWLVRWEEAIEYTFLGDQADVEYDIEFPTKELLRGDATSRASYMSRGILDGWMTRNEARLSEGMDPIDGLDEPLVPLNMVTVDQQASIAEKQAAMPEPGQAEPGPGGAPQKSARAAALADAAVDRVLRKEAANDFADADKHARFVAQVLSIPLDQARAYADQRNDMSESRARAVLWALATEGTL